MPVMPVMSDEVPCQYIGCSTGWSDRARPAVMAAFTFHKGRGREMVLPGTTRR
jgi:hypothetical protein